MIEQSHRLATTGRQCLPPRMRMLVTAKVRILMEGNLRALLLQSLMPAFLRMLMRFLATDNHQHREDELRPMCIQQRVICTGMTLYMAVHIVRLCKGLLMQAAEAEATTAMNGQAGSRVLNC